MWKQKVAVCSSHNSLRGITHHPSNIFQYPSLYIFFISNLKGLELLSHAISERSLVYNVFPSRQSLVSARFYSLLLASTSFLPWACFHQCCDTGDNFAPLTFSVLVKFLLLNIFTHKNFGIKRGPLKNNQCILWLQSARFFLPRQFVSEVFSGLGAGKSKYFLHKCFAGCNAIMPWVLSILWKGFPPKHCSDFASLCDCLK